MPQTHFFRRNPTAADNESLGFQAGDEAVNLNTGARFFMATSHGGWQAVPGLAVSGTPDTITNTTRLVFTGATVTDEGDGTVSVTVSGTGGGSYNWGRGLTNDSGTINSTGTIIQPSLTGTSVNSAGLVLQSGDVTTAGYGNVDPIRMVGGNITLTTLGAYGYAGGISGIAGSTSYGVNTGDGARFGLGRGFIESNGTIYGGRGYFSAGNADGALGIGGSTTISSGDGTLSPGNLLLSSGRGGAGGTTNGVIVITNDPGTTGVSAGAVYADAITGILHRKP